MFGVVRLGMSVWGGEVGMSVWVVRLGMSVWGGEVGGE